MVTDWSSMVACTVTPMAVFGLAYVVVFRIVPWLDRNERLRPLPTSSPPASSRPRADAG